MEIKPRVMEIKILLTKQGYSMRSFAKYLNISPSYFSDVLNLKVSPSSKYAKKVSDGLKVSMDEIFQIKEEEV